MKQRSLNRRPWQPNGKTLVELMVAIAASGALMTLSVGLIQRAVQVRSDAQLHEQVQRSGMRLARQFRHDVHHATQAVVDEGNLVLEFSSTTRRPARYSAANGIVTREQARSDGRTHREVFQFGPEAGVRFARVDDPRRVLVDVYYVDSRQTSTGRSLLQVAPAVGRLATWSEPRENLP